MESKDVKQNNETNDKITHGNFILNALEKVVRMEKKYGFFNIIKGLFVIGICLLLTYMVMNPQMTFDILSQLKEKEHKEMMDKRMSIEPELRVLIKGLRIETNADRAYVCEFHNGTNNLNGMPFLYADMRYEDVAKGVDNVDYDYQNQPLSRFSISSEVFTNRYWFGTMDELEEIDSRLATRMRVSNIKWAAFIMLDGNVQEVGVLGLSFTEIPDFESQKRIGKKIRNAAIKISILLGQKDY